MWGGAIEENEVVIRLQFLNLLKKHKIGRDRWIGSIDFALQVDQVEGGRNDIEPWEQLLAQFALYDVFDHDILNLVFPWYENRIDGTFAIHVQFVLAIQTHQPDAGIRLGVEIEQENALSLFHKGCGRVHDQGGFSDASFIVDEADFPSHRQSDYWNRSVTCKLFHESIKGLLNLTKIGPQPGFRPPRNA